jgi:dTDP-4-dehydrorhamnose 3,5-epimerase
MIDGVVVAPLRQIHDDRGCVMHMLRRDDPHFEEFGEIYFSVALPGVVKGWHLHKAMTLNYVVVRGAIKLVLFDDRAESPTRGEIQELFPAETDYFLVRVPPGVWNAFQALGSERATVANCATLPHDPDEIVRVDPFVNSIPYDWALPAG